MARKQIPDKVKKKLFALSGNQCCFPGCTERVYKLEDEVQLGEMCHIRAVNPSGARYDAELPEEEVNSFDNLLVMCPTHHTTIDNDEEKYTTELLLQIKAEHESKFYYNAELFDKTIEKLEGEIGADNLKELEALDETIKEAQSGKVLPAKKVYPATDNYITRYVSPARGDTVHFGYELNTLAEVLEKEDRLTILGVAGSGKSVELAHLAHLHSKPESELIPIKIRLNVLTSQEIEDLLTLEYPDFGDVPEENLLILLDALDEVHTDYIDIASSKIEILSKRYPKAKIVVTCRNNFYITETEKRSAKLEGFSSYLIHPLQYDSIYGYLQDRIDIRPEHFIEDLRLKKFYELLYSPFYLVNLVKFYEAKKEIPTSKKTVFEHLISQRIEDDFEKFANAGINIQDHTNKVQKSIRQLAAVAESLGRSYLDEKTEVQPLVPDQKLLEIIKRTFLFNKSTEGDKWEFEHNNFQEYLAAHFLSKLSFEEIQKFVSFRPDYKKIKPSWLNTVSFLFSLLELGQDTYEKLTTWIMDVEPDILVRFEKDKLELKIREKLFREIYDDYESKQIIIRNEKFETEDLAIFVSDSTETLEYLLQKIESSVDKLVTTEALRILHYFDKVAAYSERIREILMSKLCSSELSVEIKYACFNALAKLEIGDEELTAIILETNDFETNQYLRAGFYRYLGSTSHYEKYLPILLRGIELIEGIRVTRIEQPRNGSSHLFDEKFALEAVLKKIKTPESIKLFFEWAAGSEEPSGLERVFFEQVGKMLEKAAAFSSDLPELFEGALNLLSSFSRRYHRELSNDFLKFFNKTNTQLKAFKILYEDWQKEENIGFELAYGMATVCNEDCLRFLVKEIKEGKFIEPRTWQFRNVLGMDVRREMHDQYQQELLNIDSEKYSLEIINHEALRTARQKRDIELLFAKREFLGETKKLFREESKTNGTLTWKELNDWKRINFNDDEISNHIVVETLRDFAHDKEYVELKEIEDLVTDDKRWLWFQLHKIVQFDQNKEDFEYTDEAREFITSWVHDELKTANFKTALEYKTENRYHYRYSELYISFFIQRLDIEVTEDVYLDLLSIQCYLLPIKYETSIQASDTEERKPNSFDFVISKIGQEKVIKRGLENLEAGGLVPIVKQSHYQFCKDFKVSEAAPLILAEILSDAWDNYDQRTFITQYTELSADPAKLIESIDQLENESKLHSVNELAEAKYYPVAKKIEALVEKEEDEEAIFRYIQVLGKIDENTGFSLLKEWILRNKRLPDHFARFNLINVGTIDDLIEIFEDTLAEGYGKGPWPNRNDWLVALIEKGSEDEDSFIRVRDQLNQWLGEYEDLKFLYYQIQSLEQKYYSKKSQVLTFEQAVELVKPLNIKAMSGEHTVRLMELEVELKRLESEYELAKEGLRSSKRYIPMAMLSGFVSLALAFTAFMTTGKEFLTGNHLIFIFIILAAAVLLYYSLIFGRMSKIKAKISKTEKEIQIEIGKGTR